MSLPHVSLREYERCIVNLSDRSRAALEKEEHFVSVSRADANGSFDVTASHWVGSMTLPDGHITVAPKVGGANALRMMLESEGELPESWKDCLARIESNDLWDALALALGREMALIRAAGYQGAYAEEEDNKQCVRGKILPLEDLRLNHPIRRGVFSRDAVWSFDIQVNQALSWAALTLANLARYEAIKCIEAEASLLHGVQAVPPIPDWLPHPEDRYRRAIFLTQLLRRAWAPRTSSFGYTSLNAIVNMYDVFESFVRARLRRATAQLGLNVLEKGFYRRQFSPRVQVEPDLVFANKDGRVVAIGDVKYKWKWSFENSDVFQMNAYLDCFPEAAEAYVFYPDDTTMVYTPIAENLPRGRKIVGVPLHPRRMFEERFWGNFSEEFVRTTQAIQADSRKP